MFNMSEAASNVHDFSRRDHEASPPSMSERRTFGRTALRETDTLAAEFETFITPHISLILGVARSALHNSQEAEDVLQEVLIKAWRAFTDGSRPPKAWLIAVTRTTIIDRYRQEQRRPATASVDFSSFENQNIHPTYSLEETLREGMLAGDDVFMKFLLEALQTQHISGEELLELVVKVANGFKVAEYARERNMPGGQARRHLHIARNQAKKYTDLIHAYMAGEDVSLKVL